MALILLKFLTVETNKSSHVHIIRFWNCLQLDDSLHQQSSGKRNCKLVLKSLLHWFSDSCHSLLYQCPGLLLLSCFSRVQLCAAPQMAAHQAPLSLGFSRQEHWSGCHFLLQCTKVKKESEVAQSCPTLSDLMDCSLPGSSIHGVFQAGPGQ